MEEAGLSDYEDAAGNLFSRREGSNPETPAVLIGYHVDPVYDGGNFDGLLSYGPAWSPREGCAVSYNPLY